MAPHGQEHSRVHTAQEEHRLRKCTALSMSAYHTIRTPASNTSAQATAKAGIASQLPKCRMKALPLRQAGDEATEGRTTCSGPACTDVCSRINVGAAKPQWFLSVPPFDGVSEMSTSTEYCRTPAGFLLDALWIHRLKLIDEVHDDVVLSKVHREGEIVCSTRLWRPPKRRTFYLRNVEFSHQLFARNSVSPRRQSRFLVSGTSAVEVRDVASRRQVLLQPLVCVHALFNDMHMTSGRVSSVSLLAVILAAVGSKCTTASFFLVWIRLLPCLFTKCTPWNDRFMSCCCCCCCC